MLDSSLPEGIVGDKTDAVELPDSLGGTCGADVGGRIPEQANKLSAAKASVSR
jgi:hypothetical protein